MLRASFRESCWPPDMLGDDRKNVAIVANRKSPTNGN